MIEAKNPNFKITAREVMSAYSNVKSSNFIYQISKQKEQLRSPVRVNSINEHCSELADNQKQKLIKFCEKWGGACRYTYIECCGTKGLRRKKPLQ
jgi:hypothetical protein